MLAHIKDVPESRIRAGIYLIALLRWEEMYAVIIDTNIQLYKIH